MAKLSNRDKCIKEWADWLAGLVESREYANNHAVYLEQLIGQLYDNIKMEFNKPFTAKLYKYKKEVDKDAEQQIEYHKKQVKKYILRDIRNYIDGELDCDCCNDDY